MRTRGQARFGAGKRKAEEIGRTAAAARNIGDEIIAGLQEAIAFERGKKTGARFKAAQISARKVKVAPARNFSPKAIMSIRKSLNLSQTVFAHVLNVSPETEKAWEQGKSPPSGPSKRLLEIAASHPAIILSGVLRATGKPTSAVRPSGQMVAAVASPHQAERRSGTDRRRRHSR